MKHIKLAIGILIVAVVILTKIFYKPEPQGAYTDEEVEFIKQAVRPITPDSVIWKGTDSLVELSNLLGYTKNLKRLNDSTWFDSTKIKFILYHK